MPEPTDTSRDYRATLFLPTTDFPMKAGLPVAEPKWLARWEALDLYGRVREAAKGREIFVLHDGPIYANGDIHTGTGMNHILKDFVVRSQTMLGKDAPYVPGWDCHGLPIEWKVEEKYRAEGRAKDDVPKDELRRDCRAFASGWLNVQREQIKRLGCMGEWAHPYTTMDYRAEAAIAREAHKFVANGLLYRGFRPVMWSPVEKTALADAEVEYHERTSSTIYVKFPVRTVGEGNDREFPELIGSYVIIWTTTPWTIPGNRAIAYSDTIEYGLYEVEAVEDASFAAIGERYLLADSLAPQVAHHAKSTLRRLRNVDLKYISQMLVDHPFRKHGYEFGVPLLPASHVTADTGTGFVHTAPGHGEEDFEVGREFGLEIPKTVDEDGKFTDAVRLPSLIGKHILSRDGKKDGDANGAVIAELVNAGKLLSKGTLRHSYPHSWRSKAPVIFLVTPQWFVGIDKPMKEFGGDTMRARAMKAIADTRWYPPQGANRIGAMVESRPDWVLSRQRAWGVPLAIFVNKKSGVVLNDAVVNARIGDFFEKEGADSWFVRPASDFLGNAYDAEDYEQIKDILDVWFDSGSTYTFTVENPLRPEWPKAERADLYLEGSDQHRGWFQSSLLESVGTRGHAPYKAVLTHGFVMDDKGYKMSKSLGNTLAPQVIAEKNGADILRLWAASSDFTEDLRIGADIINANVDAYRRLRNTIRFMLANLSGFDARERTTEFPELERYMLARLAELDALVRDGYAAYDFNRVFAALFNFCTNDLSAFYFDIRKDSLYCDRKDAPRRRAARTVLDEIFRRVVIWLAPILCFTMEEAWLLQFPGEHESVHLHAAPETPASWHDDELVQKWARIRQLRRIVTGALEIARRDKVIGASLEARPVLFVSADDAKLLDGLDLGEIAITSGAKVSVYEPSPEAFRLPEVADTAAAFHHAEGDKCARCWMILPEVGQNKVHPDLCNRCAEAVDALEGTAA